MLRRIVERFSRGVVLRRRLPSRWGSGILYVSPESGGLKYWKRNLLAHDPALFLAVEQFVHPGDSVWDVGANVGLFTFAAAYRAGSTGTVLAIEPDLDNANLLLRSRRVMDRQTYAAVEILAAAVSTGTEHIARFAVAQRARAANALEGFGSEQMGRIREVRTVPVFSLDELLSYFPPPQALKIDIEGAEALALAGARRMLTDVRPVVIMEVSQQNAEEVGRVLTDHRYRMYDGDAEPTARRALTTPPWNCLAVPSEKTDLPTIVTTTTG